jgi:hypothetical protein
MPIDGDRVEYYRVRQGKTRKDLGVRADGNRRRENLPYNFKGGPTAAICAHEEALGV